MDWFPSPIGVLYISMTNADRIRNMSDEISVPYWGSLYFNVMTFHQTLVSDNISVPYWGSLYFKRNHYRALVTIVHFRPLLGFFIFQKQAHRAIKL